MDINRVYEKLEMIISDADRNIIDLSHFYRWQEFKEEWSEEDKIYWESLLKMVYKNKSGGKALKRSLSTEEKEWIAHLLQRATNYGIFK